ncbi:flagellar basal body-associated FliL family protein [Anaerobiospirillum sp. NML120449]|uniref:flagellar basal body-associated FliL family protein n=1 Tax=Anaerobiospirillum sp. NML120449 TaxID=2932817 RepID=UPI001FF2678A|nr:flagellar basal body-associated FliL family protein [Anaerobiospirillum sp. NML120449]MCK0527453.1 flagellar basal body-associated FliL family protein [Anaerobiospirillum sp. NML120449]
MSDSTDDLETGGKSRKMLFMLIGVILVFILGIGGYGTFAYLHHMWPFAMEEQENATDIAGKMAGQNSQVDVSDRYVRFDLAFTFNLPGKTKRGHMVQVEPVLVVHGSENAALAQQHLPLISSTISEICSQQDYDSLASPSGRQRFKRLLLDGIRTKLTGVVNQPVVEQVLFVNFVMQ